MVYTSFKINILNCGSELYLLFCFTLFISFFLILEVLLLDCNITFCFDNEQNKIRNRVLLLFIMTEPCGLKFIQN